MVVAGAATVSRVLILSLGELHMSDLQRLMHRPLISAIITYRSEDFHLRVLHYSALSSNITYEDAGERAKTALKGSSRLLPGHPFLTIFQISVCCR